MSVGLPFAPIIVCHGVVLGAGVVCTWAAGLAAEDAAANDGLGVGLEVVLDAFGVLGLAPGLVDVRVGLVRAGLVRAGVADLVRVGVGVAGLLRVGVGVGIGGFVVVTRTTGATTTTGVTVDAGRTRK